MKIIILQGIRHMYESLQCCTDRRCVRAGSEEKMDYGNTLDPEEHDCSTNVIQLRLQLALRSVLPDLMEDAICLLNSISEVNKVFHVD